ncbi:hypothetical protein P8452_43435 [Trifolium repens]|nr:hypothetical protein P8452_43435 [Trifolium repens]
MWNSGQAQGLWALDTTVKNIEAIWKCESDDNCPRSTEDMLPYKWKCINHKCRFVLFFTESDDEKYPMQTRQ